MTKKEKEKKKKKELTETVGILKSFDWVVGMTMVV
jgi:hypothetical protein